MHAHWRKSLPRTRAMTELFTRRVYTTNAIQFLLSFFLFVPSNPLPLCVAWFILHIIDYQLTCSLAGIWLIKNLPIFCFHVECDLSLDFVLPQVHFLSALQRLSVAVIFTWKLSRSSSTSPSSASLAVRSAPLLSRSCRFFSFWLVASIWREINRCADGDGLEGNI